MLFQSCPLFFSRFVWHPMAPFSMWTILSANSMRCLSKNPSGSKRGCASDHRWEQRHVNATAVGWLVPSSTLVKVNQTTTFPVFFKMFMEQMLMVGVWNHQLDIDIYSINWHLDCSFTSLKEAGQTVGHSMDNKKWCALGCVSNVRISLIVTHILYQTRWLNGNPYFLVQWEITLIAILDSFQPDFDRSVADSCLWSMLPWNFAKTFGQRFDRMYWGSSMKVMLGFARPGLKV